MRLLVVEDEARFANTIAEGLRDQGLAVDVAYDGLEAAAKINLNPYDVIVLDRDLPADDYLPKPFHFPELVLRVRALARRKPAAQSRTLASAGIELDPLRRTVTRDGTRLELPAKEFAVLEALLRASPGALTAERLLEQAWDENTDPFTNTVRVTIARLPRKLGEPDVIENTPGIGYRIGDDDVRTRLNDHPLR